MNTGCPKDRQSRGPIANAGRDLRKAAIDDIITRGNIGTWRGLVKAMCADDTGKISRLVREVATVLGKDDKKARASGTLLAQAATLRTKKL